MFLPLKFAAFFCEGTGGNAISYVIYVAFPMLLAAVCMIREVIVREPQFRRHRESAKLGLDKSEMTGHIVLVRSNVREQLLDTGLRVLHERGFNATSVQDITEAASVPKGSFYNHFESKEDLGAEVVSRYLESSKKTQAVLRDPKLSPYARLRKYFEGLVQVAEKRSSVAAACWVILEPNFPSKARRFVTVFPGSFRLGLR